MMVKGANSAMPKYQVSPCLGFKTWPHPTQSSQLSSDGERPWGVQQKRFDVPQLVEQNPSFTSNNAPSRRMMQNAMRAEKIPMRVAATHPCSLSHVFAIDPRRDLLAACRRRRTRDDSLIYRQRIRKRGTYRIMNPIYSDIRAIPHPRPIGSLSWFFILCI